MAREGRETEMQGPYTHAVHARRCGEAARHRQVLSEQYLQIKSGPVVYCCRVLCAWDHADAGEMWKVEVVYPIKGIQSFPAKRSRQCGGVDDRCICEHDAKGRRAKPAPVAAGSEGLTC
jgi:hypothetical protein